MLNMKNIVLIFCGLLAVVAGQSIPTNTIKFESRIANGENATVGDRPFQVSLQTLGNFHFCGGAILNANWVITAAHCAVPLSTSEIQIVAGTTDLRNPYSTHKVTQKIVHENYTPSDNHRNDIALLKVATPFRFEKGRIETVALPRPHEDVKTNSPAVVSGWGLLLDWSAPKILQRATIYIADPNYCHNVMKEKGMKVSPTQLCAFNPRVRRGQCSGDSGGPLTVDGILVGIVSLSQKDPLCASTKYPGIYTRVSEYVDWIQKHIRQNKYCICISCLDY